MAKKIWTYTPTKQVHHTRHAKSKTSSNKGTTNYVKTYRGQGR